MSESIPDVFYLDWGVIIDLAEKSKKRFENALTQAQNEGSIIIPFSSVHVDEADNIADSIGQEDDFVEQRLQYLSHLAQNTYLYNGPDAEGALLQTYHPHDVRETITAIDWAKSAVNESVSLFGFDMMGEFRDQMGIGPNRLNNVEPPNVIEKIDRQVQEQLRKQHGEEAPDFGVQKLLETAVDAHRLVGQEDLGIESDIAAVFTALNWFGFWPDKEGSTNLVAGFNDSQHAAVAIFCDFFVSDDKALRLKTAAAYEFFGVETVVLSSSKAEELLKNEYA